jgi:hypothetical protein
MLSQQHCRRFLAVIIIFGGQSSTAENKALFSAEAAENKPI